MDLQFEDYLRIISPKREVKMSNWVIYYCYDAQRMGYDVPSTVHSAEIPNSWMIDEEAARKLWASMYHPVTHNISCLAVERAPVGYHEWGIAGYAARARELRAKGQRPPVRGLPEVGFEVHREKQGRKIDPDEAMKAVRDMSSI